AATTVETNAAAAGNGQVYINVNNGSFDKLVMVDSGVDQAVTITVDNTWTQNGGLFTVDASALVSEDVSTATGATIIDGSNSDAATLTILGSQNDDTITGSDFVDVISGNAGDDTINGGLGDDTINGNDGNDILNGEAGVDTINGGAGNDTITGGAAGDILTGGTGADTFVYASATESNNNTATTSDTITDFETGTDVIAVTIDMSTTNANQTFNVSEFNGSNNTVGDAASTSLNGKIGDYFWSHDGVLAVDMDGNNVINANDLYIKSANVVAAKDVHFTLIADSTANATVDTFEFTSANVATVTIENFGSNDHGNALATGVTDDVLDFSALGLANTTSYAGAQLAEGTTMATSFESFVANGMGATTGNNYIYVDANQDGVFNAAHDIAIVLVGTGDITWATQVSL
ncbi:MAG: calcium-binding protein, partial [Methylovulum sp.]|nr:calcium-binding protein [Methylovulum sp.]